MHCGHSGESIGNSKSFCMEALYGNMVTLRGRDLVELTLKERPRTRFLFGHLLRCCVMTHIARLLDT